ncbi:MAG: Lrp/AsnC family transcriptional regulator [Cyanothece sp. SIO2G6]|nr:Lrp/AsnC family transcriptional regulator [Cyanothece sp. SIO2G6]
MDLNEVDFRAIQYLMTQGRITWSELAGVLELSAPATADRVRRLEERGVISGYAALVDPDAIGCGLTAFVSVTLEKSKHLNTFLKKVQNLPEIQECHHVTGEDDYLLKIRCRDTAELERLVGQELKSITGISKTRTTIVLSTAKESPILPLNWPSDDAADEE